MHGDCEWTRQDKTHGVPTTTTIRLTGEMERTGNAVDSDEPERGGQGGIFNGFL